MIPVYQPALSGNERKYVDECIDTSWISSKGRFISEFEKAFAHFVGARHAVAVCNGTVALHLALLAAGIAADDEVIVPTLTYVASPNAIAYCGAKPVFADSDRETWQIDPGDIRRKITRRTKAIMPVHLYGHPCDMAAIMSIAEQHGLVVIEDAAEGFGTRFAGKHVGTFGKLGTFSFFGNKTITCGEGGMVVTDDPATYASAMLLKGQGVDPNRAYWHPIIGYNYRMTNIAAAIGLAQLEQADSKIAAKIELARWYDEFLSGADVVTHVPHGDVTHTYWMYSVLVPASVNRDGVMRAMAQAGIETRPFFYPAHILPMYAGAGGSFPVATELSGRGMNLPSWPGLTRANVKTIVDALLKAIRI